MHFGSGRTKKHAICEGTANYNNNEVFLSCLDYRQVKKKSGTIMSWSTKKYKKYAA